MRGVARFPLSLSFAALSLGAMMLSGCVFASLKYQTVESQTLSLPESAGRLVVRNTVGNVTLIADPAATGVTAEIEKMGKGATQEDADLAVKEIIVSLAFSASDPKVIEGIVSHPKSRSWRAYGVNWTITAPPDMAIDVLADVGNISATGFTEGARLVTDVGDVTAASLVGGVTAEADVGDIAVETTGAISAHTDVGGITVTARQGRSPESIDLKSDVGDVRLYLSPEWVGELEVSTSVGSIKLNESGAPIRKVTRRERKLSATFGAENADARPAKAKLASSVGDVVVTMLAQPAPVETERVQ